LENRTDIEGRLTAREKWTRRTNGKDAKEQ
jgi:hypothetical protein